MQRVHAIPIDSPPVSPKSGRGISGPFFYSVSLLLHGLLLIAMMFVQSVNVVDTHPPAVQVDLVSFSELGDLQPISTTDLSNPNELTNVDPSKQEEVASFEKIPEIDTEMASEIETASDSELAADSEPPSEKKSFFDSEPTMPELKPIEPEMAPLEPPVEKRPPTVEKKKEPEESPAVVTKKYALKKKTLDAEKVRALKQKKPESEEQKTASPPKTEEKPSDTKDHLADALARMKERVATGEEGRAKTETSSPSEGVAGGVTGGRASSQPIELYKLALFYRIRQNWSFNDKLAGGQKNLEVVICLL